MAFRSDSSAGRTHLLEAGRPRRQHHHTRGQHLYNPNSGVILRANPDGTEAEIFASGLRNPQDFAFDEYGNLISPDNDGDHPGELERLVYVVDGMDSGWRINWQFGKYVDPDNNTYKVWMDESMFKPRLAGQAAYFTPPIAPWHAGPAGFAYNPGTALERRWKRLLLQRRASPERRRAPRSGLHLAPQGAGFKLDEDTAMVQRRGPRHGREVRSRRRALPRDWIEGWDPKAADASGSSTSLRPANPAARERRRSSRRTSRSATSRISSACCVTPTCAFARRRSSSSSIAMR